MGLSVSSEGVEEHMQVSQMLETALVVDGLDVSNLESFEQNCRRYQLWEQVYGDLLRESESRSTVTEFLRHDEKALFMGSSFSRGLALVCPALEKHVSEALHDKSSLLKEQRKARQERMLVFEEKPEGAAGEAGRGRGRGNRQPKNPPKKD